MKLTMKRITAVMASLLAYFTLQSSALAQPMMVPELLIVEESYVEAPANGQESTNAYFTITNLHHDPIRLLKTKPMGGEYESAKLVGANNEELEYIEILPSQRIVMDPAGMHVQLSGVDADAVKDENTLEFTLLVRQGREALPYQEGGFDSGTRRQIREGIPNEHEFTVNVPVRNY